MAFKIPRSEMIEYARSRVDLGLRAGTEVKINHKDCPAGVDTRSRLYLKVTEDDRMLLAHCFNCNGSGAIRVGIKAGTTVSIPVHTIDEYDKAVRRYNIVRDRYEWAAKLSEIECPEFKQFPWRYFNNPDDYTPFREADCFGIREYLGTVIIPRGDTEDPSGFEVRDDSATSRLKWTRVLDPARNSGESPGNLALIYATQPTDHAVLVEDPISAMKIALAGYAGIAQCGARVPSPEFIVKLKGLYETTDIWYDNDNDTVRGVAKEARKLLDLYGLSSAMISDKQDPKHYSLKEIRTTIGVNC